MIKLNNSFENLKYSGNSKIEIIYKNLADGLVKNLQKFEMIKIVHKNTNTNINISDANEMFRFLTSKKFYEYEFSYKNDECSNNLTDIFTDISTLLGINYQTNIDTVIKNIDIYNFKIIRNELLKYFNNRNDSQKKTEDKGQKSKLTKKLKETFLEKEFENEFNLYNKLKERFSYSKISNNKNNRDIILSSIDISVCPYCNRNYVSDYIYDKKIKSTADLDHFYPKSHNILYTLCLYNFIPSCAVCNSRMKLAQNMNVDDYVYPYDNSFENKADFKIDNLIELILKNDNAKIKLDNFANDEKVKKSISSFKLEEVYQVHAKMVEKLVDKALIYNDTYREELENFIGDVNTKFDKNTNINFNEVRELYMLKSLIFGARLNEDDFRHQSLGKLKRDILVQLGIYEKKY